MPDVGRNESYRAIPASTKPLSSTLKWILDYYPMQLSVVTKTTLEKNFTQTDILYLTNKERYLCKVILTALFNYTFIIIIVYCNIEIFNGAQRYLFDMLLKYWTEVDIDDFSYNINVLLIREK